MPHIVLLSESIGAGHDRAASAIEEALFSLYPDVQVTRLNLLDTFRPLTAKVTRTLYLETLAHRPKWWGKWYEWQREKEMNRFSRLIVHRALQKDVEECLNRLAPDAIVCTHPLPTCLIAGMKRKGLQVPLCTVLTDFDMHGYWTHPGVDLYCVPIKEIASVLYRRVKGRSEIRVTGIPIANSFTKSRTGKDHNSSPTKHILIMGGGLGIGIMPVVEQIVESDFQNKFTVVCGSNESLQNQLSEKYGHRQNVRIMGYTKQIAQLMADSDLLVTKPGGLTIAEALAMKVPMVLYTPIPGQEWRNGQLMAELGVARTVFSAEDVADQVYQLQVKDQICRQMAQQMQAVRQPFAAKEVAMTVMELIQTANHKYSYQMIQ